MRSMLASLRHRLARSAAAARRRRRARSRRSKSASASASGERDRCPPSGRNCLAHASISSSSPCSIRRSASGKPAAAASTNAAPALIEPKWRSLNSLSASINKPRLARRRTHQSLRAASGSPRSKAARPQVSHANRRSAVSSGSQARSSHSPNSSTHMSTRSAMREIRRRPNGGKIDQPRERMQPGREVSRRLGRRPRIGVFVGQTLGARCARRRGRSRARARDRRRAGRRPNARCGRRKRRPGACDETDWRATRRWRELAVAAGEEGETGAALDIRPDFSSFRILSA